MGLASDVADERISNLENTIKLLEAKILSYRQILKDVVLEDDYKKLKEISYVYTEKELLKKYSLSREELINRLFKKMNENPIMGEFDEHFEITTDKIGKI